LNLELNEDVIKELIGILSAKGIIFDSEDDFKFSLAWLIKEKYGEHAEVRLEKRMNYNNGPKGNKVNERLDIFIKLQNCNSEKSIGIELKYFTSALECKGKGVNLTSQGAENLRSYDALHDIERLERFKDEGKIDEGFAIWLTNDERYWKCRKHSEEVEGKKSKKPDYYNFRICEGRTINGDTLDWKNSKGDKSKGKREGPINIIGKYTIHWDEYNVRCDEVSKNSTFKFAIIKIYHERTANMD